jgi:hypothetical protein
MRRYTYDFGDIVAGAIGPALVLPLLWWHKRLANLSHRQESGALQVLD